VTPRTQQPSKLQEPSKQLGGSCFSGPPAKVRKTADAEAPYDLGHARPAARRADADNEAYAEYQSLPAEERKLLDETFLPVAAELDEGGKPH
jgi:hypothetical protein